MKKVSAALDIARSLKNFIRVNLGQDGSLYIPVQIIIDNGSYLMADKLVLDRCDVNWAAIKPCPVSRGSGTGALVYLSCTCIPSPTPSSCSRCANGGADGRYTTSRQQELSRCPSLCYTGLQAERTMSETLIGTIERITYYNEENGYTVAQVTPKSSFETSTQRLTVK